MVCGYSVLMLETKPLACVNSRQTVAVTYTSRYLVSLFTKLRKVGGAMFRKGLSYVFASIFGSKELKLCGLIARRRLLPRKKVMGNIE